MAITFFKDKSFAEGGVARINSKNDSNAILQNNQKPKENINTDNSPESDALEQNNNTPSSRRP